MSKTGRIESLTVLLANGHTYDIDAAEGNDLLKVLFDTSEPWMRFSTVDGKVIHIAKDAIIALENPKPGHPVTEPMGFSTETARIETKKKRDERAGAGGLEPPTS